MVDAVNPSNVWAPFGAFSMAVVQGEGQIVHLKGQVAVDRSGHSIAVAHAIPTVLLPPGTVTTARVPCECVSRLAGLRPSDPNPERRSSRRERSEGTHSDCRGLQSSHRVRWGYHLGDRSEETRIGLRSCGLCRATMRNRLVYHG